MIRSSVSQTEKEWDHVTNRKGNWCLEMSALVILCGWKRQSVWVRSNRKDRKHCSFHASVNAHEEESQLGEVALGAHGGRQCWDSCGCQLLPGQRLHVFSWCCDSRRIEDLRTPDDGCDVDFGRISSLVDRSAQYGTRFVPWYFWAFCFTLAIETFRNF